MVLNDIVEAVFACSWRDRQLGLSVTHYRVITQLVNGLTSVQVANALNTIFAPLYAAYLPIACRFLGCRVQVIFPAPTGAAGVTTQDPVDGTQDTEPLPPQVAMLAKRITPLAGRANRGRTYLPFWGEDDNSGLGVPTPVALTRAEAVFAAHDLDRTIIVLGDGITLRPIIWRRPGHIDPALDNTSIDVTGHVKRLSWATQRRRSDINHADVIKI